MILREMWLLVRDTALAIRNLPDLLASWCDRKVMEAHRPEPMPTEDLAEWPGGVMPVCLRCNVVWPCELYARASDRMDERSGT